MFPLSPSSHVRGDENKIFKNPFYKVLERKLSMYFKWLGTEIQYIKFHDIFFNEIKITLQQFVS